MKKIISFICIVLLFVTITAMAGDVPESLLYEDGAKVFFAKVTYYNFDKENPDVEYIPTKRIKGDVEIGKKQTAYRPSITGDFDIKEGEVYLFTYFDENNPTDIFETTSQDTKTLKLKHTKGDMWERFEEYLNDGKYEEAELKRTGKLNDIEKIKKAKTFSELFLTDRKDVEKIEVIYPGDGDPAGCYVDKDKFFDIAETISLIPINRINKLDIDNGVWIVAIDKNDNRNSVWLNNKAGVGCPQYETSSAVTTQYDIIKSDYKKLYAFLPEEATAHIPHKNPMKIYAVIAVCISVLVFVAGFVFAFKKGSGKV